MEDLNNLTVVELKAALLQYGKTEEELKGLLKPALVELYSALSASGSKAVDFEQLSKEELLEVIKGQNKVVEELKSQAEAKKDVKGTVTAKRGGKTYRFAVPKFTLPAFGETIPGRQYTAEEAAAIPEVIEQLVSIKSGILKEVK